MLHQQTHWTTHTEKGVGTVVSSSSIILFIAISQENLQSRAMIRENRQLVTDEPVEFEN